MSDPNWDWNNGNPPHSGWFNAVLNLDNPYRSGVWRYYDKPCNKWSGPVYEPHREPNMINAALHTITKRERDSPIVYWTWRWPKNARIARINPETGECTGAGPWPGCHVSLDVGNFLMGPKYNSYNR